MAKVHLICGKICSGKSRYAERLKQKENAVVLSCDEIMLDFAKDGFACDFDQLTEQCKCYLYKKAVEIARCGTNVILDFGFWAKAERQSVSAYFEERDIVTQWHYIDISDSDWMANIQERNRAIRENQAKGYIMDDGLMRKLTGIFEEPARDEIDVWYTYHKTVH